MDTRFPAPGTDDRFPALGVDSYFPAPGADSRFSAPGVDTRFAAQSIAIVSAPALGALVIGQSVASLFTAGAYTTSNTSISSQVATATINGVSGQPMSTVISDLDVISVQELVTDDQGETFTGQTGSLTARYAAPSATNGLGPFSYSSGSGNQTVDVSGEFTGAVGGSYSLVSSPAGVTLIGSIVTIPTTSSFSSTPISVSYTNSGGTAITSFDVTVAVTVEPFGLAGFRSLQLPVDANGLKDNGNAATITQPPLTTYPSQPFFERGNSFVFTVDSDSARLNNGAYPRCELRHDDDFASNQVTRDTTFATVRQLPSGHRTIIMQALDGGGSNAGVYKIRVEGGTAGNSDGVLSIEYDPTYGASDTSVDLLTNLSVDAQGVMEQIAISVVRYPNKLEVYLGNNVAGSTPDWTSDDHIPFFRDATSGTFNLKKGNYYQRNDNVVVTTCVVALDAGTFENPTIIATSVPTVIALSNSSINENATGFVGTMSTTGGFGPYSYSVNAPFSTSGDQLRLDVAQDYDAGSTSLIANVVVTDAHLETLPETFVVAITDVNEAPVTSPGTVLYDFLVAPPPAVPVPVNSVAPVVTPATTTVGTTYTITDGTWSGLPSSYTYQWQADGSDIIGETANTFDSTGRSAAEVIGGYVVAVNAGGSSAPAPSNTITLTAAVAGTLVQLADAEDQGFGTSGSFTSGGSYPPGQYVIAMGIGSSVPTVVTCRGETANLIGTTYAQGTNLFVGFWEATTTDTGPLDWDVTTSGSINRRYATMFDPDGLTIGTVVGDNINGTTSLDLSQDTVAASQLAVFAGDNSSTWTLPAGFTSLGTFGTSKKAVGGAHTSPGASAPFSITVAGSANFSGAAGVSLELR